LHICGDGFGAASGVQVLNQTLRIAKAEEDAHATA
jgi:hypothetical protein